MDTFTFVLEDEPKFQTEIYGALRKISPQMKVRFFNSLEDFSVWIGQFVKDGMTTVETAGFRIPEDSEIESISSEKSIRLLVCKSEILGAKAISLIGKTIDLFVRKNACTQEDKTAIILTAFDKDDFEVKPFEVSFINNVVFKPFDSLILEEHMRYAFVGRKKPNDENFKSNKLESQVEMVKDIPCEGFSDLGFLTVADREIRMDQASKFYADEFASESIRSVMARCAKSIARTGRDQSGFLCWMEYFGLEPGQIKKFRKELINEFPSAQMTENLNRFNKNILIMEPVEGLELNSSMKRFFPQSFSFFYNDWERFIFDSSPQTSSLLADKDVPGEHTYSMFLDASGRYLLDQEPKSEIELVFGELFKDLKKKDFPQLLSMDSKRVWQEVANHKKVDLGREPILVIENIGKIFFVKLTSYQKIQAEGQATIIEIKMSRITTEEKISYIKSRSPLPSKIDIVIASDAFMTQIIDGNLYPEAKKFLVSKDPVSDKEKKRWSFLVQDIFVVPVDRNYLVKKLYLAFVERFTWTVKQFNGTKKEIQSAQQIQIDEISEAGIVFKYHRPLTIGSFRRFYLWTPNELELRDYHASCNYFDEFKEGKNVTYNHHFVFFGMKDFYLKNIRLWVRENYILSKSKE